MDSSKISFGEEEVNHHIGVFLGDGAGRHHPDYSSEMPER
jgi:hypothetical protein